MPREVQVREIMTKDVVTVSEDDTILLTTSRMTEHNISSILALDKSGRVSGLLTETDILDKVTRAKKNPEETLVKDVMTRQIISITSTDPVSLAGRIIRDKDMGILPVIDESGLAGIVSKTDVCGALGSLGFFRKVSDIMTGEVVSVSSTTPVIDATSLMVSKDISSLLVIDDGRLSGVFTKKDNMGRVVSKKKDPAKTKISEVMSPDVITTGPDTSIAEANRIQKDGKIRVLPVVREGMVVGVLSQTNILKAVESIELEYENLKEIASRGMENAASSISSMINEDVSIDIPTLEYVSIESIPDFAGSRAQLVAGVYLEVTGDLSGSVLLLFPVKTAYSLIDKMMMQETGTTTSFDEIGESALKELCNILVGNYLNVLSDSLDVKVQYSIPHFAYDMLGSVIDHILLEHSKTADNAMITKTSCMIKSTELDGLFLFLFTPESLDRMSRILDEKYKTPVN